MVDASFTLFLCLALSHQYPQKGAYTLHWCHDFHSCCQGTPVHHFRESNKKVVYLFSCKRSLVSFRRIGGNGLFCLPIFTTFQKKLGCQRSQLHLRLSKCPCLKSQSSISILTLACKIAHLNDSASLHPTVRL